MEKNTKEHGKELNLLLDEIEKTIDIELVKNNKTISDLLKYNHNFKNKVVDFTGKTCGENLSCYDSSLIDKIQSGYEEKTGLKLNEKQSEYIESFKHYINNNILFLHAKLQKGKLATDNSEISSLDNGLHDTNIKTKNNFSIEELEKLSKQNLDKLTINNIIIFLLKKSIPLKQITPFLLHENFSSEDLAIHIFKNPQNHMLEDFDIDFLKIPKQIITDGLIKDEHHFIGYESEYFSIWKTLTEKIEIEEKSIDVFLSKLNSQSTDKSVRLFIIQTILNSNNITNNQIQKIGKYYKNDKEILQKINLINGKTN